MKDSKAVQDCYRIVLEYVVTTCTPQQLAKFSKDADGWLIAHAMDGKGIVVTQESLHGKKARIKIPNLCKVLDVKWAKTSDMLQALGFKT